ncbi:MAG: hypothetical protein WCA20_37240 [Candidatus Sulfotelmatobacter sp.]
MALGKARDWAIATDESKDKWKKVISAAGFAITTRRAFFWHRFGQECST